MEKDSVFKQNVWNRMYGRNDQDSHSDSEEETTSPPHTHDKPEVKQYTVLPPPEGYSPPPLEFEEARSTTSSESSDEDSEPKKKRKRKNKRQKDICADEKQPQQPNHGDKTLTKNQKRKLKKKRRKEKLKTEAKSVPFSFSTPNDNQASVDTELFDKNRCAEDLRNFFDAIWDIYEMQEKNKSSEKQLLLTQLNDFLKSTDKHNEGQIELMKNLQKIKKLIVLGDFKAATDDISVMKSICCPLISADLCNFIVVLFEYWMKDISKKL